MLFILFRWKLQAAIVQQLYQFVWAIVAVMDDEFVEMATKFRMRPLAQAPIDSFDCNYCWMFPVDMVPLPLDVFCVWTQHLMNSTRRWERRKRTKLTVGNERVEISMSIRTVQIRTMKTAQNNTHVFFMLPQLLVADY